MEFGPEIKLENGKRPEWLQDDERMQWKYQSGSTWYGEGSPARMYFEDGVMDETPVSIRVCATHPHYTTPTPDERAVAPELVVRLVELAKRLDKDAWDDPFHSMKDEARAIVAALEPVDPMLLEARQVVAGLYEGQGVAHLREQALSGEGDEWFHTKVARAALARGRQLEKEGK